MASDSVRAYLASIPSAKLRREYNMLLGFSSCWQRTTTWTVGPLATDAYLINARSSHILREMYFIVMLALPNYHPST